MVLRNTVKLKITFPSFCVQGHRYEENETETSACMHLGPQPQQGETSPPITLGGVERSLQPGRKTHSKGLEQWVPKRGGLSALVFCLINWGGMPLDGAGSKEAEKIAKRAMLMKKLCYENPILDCKGLGN